MKPKRDDITQEEFDAWPNCARSGCRNKSCLALESKYCYPHTDDPEAKAILKAKQKPKEHNNNITKTLLYPY